MTALKTIAMQVMLVSTIMMGSHIHAKAQTGQIEGVWFNDTKEAKIQIYKAIDGKFYGKIVWLKEPLKNGKSKVDEKNPKKDKQAQPLVGLLILRGFEKDGDVYTNGTIYDPDNGKTYDCKMRPQGEKLSIRGYIGISLLGRTTVWEKAG